MKTTIKIAALFCLLLFISSCCGRRSNRCGEEPLRYQKHQTVFLTKEFGEYKIGQKVKILVTDPCDLAFTYKVGWDPDHYDTYKNKIWVSAESVISIEDLFRKTIIIDEEITEDSLTEEVKIIIEDTVPFSIIIEYNEDLNDSLKSAFQKYFENN